MQSIYQMIDAGNDPVTRRVAVAAGLLSLGEQAFALLKNRALPGGDALAMAEIAAINGAKDAARAIPLRPMHNSLDQIRCFHEFQDANNAVRIYCVVSCHGRSDVGMEALAGVNAALLTLWDMVSPIDPDPEISSVRLLARANGRSPAWFGASDSPDWVRTLVRPPAPRTLEGRTVATIALSDRACRGKCADLSGDALKEELTGRGAEIASHWLIADDASQLTETLRKIMSASPAPDMIVCSGGTGASDHDFSSDTLSKMFDRLIPGVGEYLRANGGVFTPLAWGSRSVGGVIGKTLAITLPGNPEAVREGMEALAPSLLPHLIRVIKGEERSER